MQIPHPLPDPLIELIAQRFRVIGEPMRIGCWMSCATVHDRELAGQRLGATQQNVSKHLGVLHQAGIVERSKEGTFVRYAVTDESVFGLCEQVCGGLRQQASELDHLLTTGVTS